MSRNFALDALKLCMALMVVGLHGLFLQELWPAGSDVLVNAVFRVAVPTFFLINGYYFHATAKRGGAAIQAWMLRLLKLYAVWTLVYLYFMLRDMSASQVLWNLLRGFWHLWYLVGTLMAASVALVLRRQSVGWVLALAALAYLLGCFLQYTGKMQLTGTRLDAWANHLPVYRNGLLFGFPLFALGYWLAGQHMPAWSLARAWGWFGLGGVALALEFIVMHALGLPDQTPLDMMLGLVPMAVGLLALALRSTARAPNTGLADLSTLIYLVHPLFLLVLPRWGAWQPTALTLAALLGSLALAPLVLLLRRRWPWVL